MNILIPMAGLGSRFHHERYPLPKPLIDVNGEPMIAAAVRSLGLEGKYIFVVRQDQHTALIRQTIKSILSESEIVVIDRVTEGPACTALMCSEQIDNQQELVITNCDQVMMWNAQLFLHTARLYDGCVVTYHSDTPKNSYARVDATGRVTEIREKKVISNISLNGIHYWKRGEYFVRSAQKMIEMKDRAPNGEFYIAPTYNYMIENGLTVGIHHIPNQQHNAVGVPEDLERYLRNEEKIN